MPLFKLFRSKPSESPAPAPPAQPAGRRRPAPSQAAPARAAPAATQAVPQATQVAGIPVQAPPTVPQVTVQHVQQQLGSVREDLIQPIREVLDNAFSEDMSNILDMLINEASTGMAQLQQQVEVCIMEERFDVLEEISTLASQFQELQQAAERWKAGEASSAGISLSQMTAEQQEEAQEAWLREEEERRRQDEARFREQEEAQQKWLEEQAAAQREEAARQEEQARLVREEAERERQRVQEEQEQLAREEAEQQMREEEEARIAELEEIRRQAAEEERHRGSASDAQDSFAADFDLQVIEVSDVDEVPKECDSRTDGPKIDLPGPTVEVLESWSEEASSSSDFEASPEKDHAKAEGCRRATSVSGVLSYSVAEPEAELANAPSQEVPQPEVPQERQKQVEPPVADESPKPLKQPVGPSGQDQERKSKEVPTPSQAPVHQPTVAGNSSNAVPTVERIDTSASESNVDLAQPSNACQKAKVSVGTVVQEEQVRSAEAALRCTELASQSESKHDGGMMPVPVGAASYSAAHEAEAVLLANRSEAEVFEEAVQSDLETRPGAATPAETRSDGRAPAFPEELVKSTVDEAAQCKLASQAEASVGGDSHSAAVDADEALLAHRSVQEVLPAPHLEPLERPVEPVAPKQLREEAPVRPEQPVEPVTPGGTAPSQASVVDQQQVVEPSSPAVARRLGRATAARPFDEEESRARAEEADGEEEMERHSDVRSRTDEDGRRRRRLDWPRHSRSSSEEGQRAQAPRATGSASSHIRVEELAQSRVGSKQSSKGLKGQTPREREAFLLEDSPEASDLQKWTEDLRRWAQEVDVEDELPEASRDSATSRRNSWMKEAVEDSWRQSLAWEKSDPAQPCLADPKGVKEDEDSEDAASRHEAATRFVEAFKDSKAKEFKAKVGQGVVFQPTQPSTRPQPQPQPQPAATVPVPVPAKLARPKTEQDRMELERSTRRALEEAEFWDLPVEEALRSLKARGYRSQEHTKRIADAFERRKSRRRPAAAPSDAPRAPVAPFAGPAGPVLGPVALTGTGLGKGPWLEQRLPKPQVASIQLHLSDDLSEQEAQRFLQAAAQAAGVDPRRLRLKGVSRTAAAPPAPPAPPPPHPAGSGTSRPGV